MAVGGHVQQSVDAELGEPGPARRLTAASQIQPRQQLDRVGALRTFKQTSPCNIAPLIDTLAKDGSPRKCATHTHCPSKVKPYILASTGSSRILALAWDAETKI